MKKRDLDNIDLEIIKSIPNDLARDKKIIPIEVNSSFIKIASLEQPDFSTIQYLQLLTGKKIDFTLLSPEIINQALERYYNIDVGLDQPVSQESYQVLNKLDDQGKLKKSSKNDSTILHSINQILSEAINEGISDVHFEPYEDEYRVRFRRDGKLHLAHNLNYDDRYIYISRLKIMADLDIAEKRRPQDGRIRLTSGKKAVDIRLSTMPTDFGEKIVLRILDKSAFKLEIDNLGFSSQAKEIFLQKLKLPFGLILVTGPTGSGKTTTLYTALSYINSDDVNIMTIEDPIEYNLKGINQGQVKTDIGFTFANALRSFLRQDPDVIMVGEIRDKETAEMAIRSALTGHLVFSTLHTNDAASAITRLVDMGIEPFLVATSLQLVVAQRLVRKICPHCKKEYTPSSSLLKGINIPAKKFYKGSGCMKCHQTGYFGRTAIIELIPNSETISELILNHKSSSLIQKQAIDEGAKSLKENGFEKVRMGITTLDEILKETL